MIRRILPAAAVLASCQPQYVQCNETYRSAELQNCTALYELARTFSETSIYGEPIPMDSAYTLTLSTADRAPRDSTISFRETSDLLDQAIADIKLRKQRLEPVQPQI